MKYKYFSADSQAAIEKAVNDWLAQQKAQIAIVHSDTKFQAAIVNGKQVGMVTVGLWYQ